MFINEIHSQYGEKAKYVLQEFKKTLNYFGDLMVLIHVPSLLVNISYKTFAKMCSLTKNYAVFGNIHVSHNHIFI